MNLHSDASPDPTERFTGLADLYARCRPSYPETAIDYILQIGNLNADSLLVDVGSGTGISSRLFAGRGIPVIGIEPNDDMRRQAESIAMPDNLSKPVYKKGSGEATGLPDGCADAVLCAQSFHWLQAETALREFHRILKPGGLVVLMWNERDESDPFTFAYGEVIRTAPDTKKIEGSRTRAGEVLLAHPLFEKAHRIAFTNAQHVDEAGMVGRAMSASYAPREPEAVKKFKTDLHEVFEKFQHNDHVTLCYETSLFCAHKQ